jgi:hypothetical protein
LKPTEHYRVVLDRDHAVLLCGTRRDCVVKRVQNEAVADLVFFALPGTVDAFAVRVEQDAVPHLGIGRIGLEKAALPTPSMSLAPTVIHTHYCHSKAAGRVCL